MYLTNLKIKNFISVKNLDFNFDNGMIGVFGKNGSGKSTVFRDSILFALYGTASRNKSLKEYVKRGEIEFAISLEFYSNNNLYRIIRTYNKKSNTKQVILYINGEKEEGLKTEIQQYLNEIINLDEKIFNHTILIKPKSKSILEISNKERKEFFYNILDLHQFKKYYNISKSAKTAVDKSIAVLDHELARLQKNIIQDKDTLHELSKKENEFDEILTLEKQILQYNESKSLIGYLKKELGSVINQIENIPVEDIDPDQISISIEEIKNTIVVLNSKYKNNQESINKFSKLLKASNLENQLCPTCEKPLDIEGIEKYLSKLEEQNKSIMLEQKTKKDFVKKLKNHEKKEKLLLNKSELEVKLNNVEQKDFPYDVKMLMDSKSKKNKLNEIKNRLSSNQDSESKVKEELVEDNKKYSALQEIIDFSLNVPDQIIEHVFKALIEKANEFLSLTPNPQYLDANNVKKTQAFYNQCSTGEQFKINLILRIALNAILSDVLKKKPIEVLILDEGGLGNLDLDIANNILQILESLSQANVLKQIIVITHQSDLLEYCHNTYEVFKDKEKNYTEIKKEI